MAEARIVKVEPADDFLGIVEINAREYDARQRDEYFAILGQSALPLAQKTAIWDKVIQEIPETLGTGPKNGPFLQCIGRFTKQLAHVFKCDEIEDVFRLSNFFNAHATWKKEDMNRQVRVMRKLELFYDVVEIPESNFVETGEEFFLLYTKHHTEFFVRRALVAIRFRNTGFMRTASLLDIIKNSVATAQLIRLIKCIYVDVSMIHGDIYPSDAKFAENQREIREVLESLRNTKRLDLDISGDRPYDEFGMTEVRDAPYSSTVSQVVMLMYQAIMKSYPKLGYTPPVVKNATPNYFISEWAGEDVAPSITETITEIQLKSRAGKMTAEQAIEVLSKSAENMTLLAEACAFKYRLNSAKKSNLSIREKTSTRVELMWGDNVQLLAARLR